MTEKRALVIGGPPGAFGKTFLTATIATLLNMRGVTASISEHTSRPHLTRVLKDVAQVETHRPLFETADISTRHLFDSISAQCSAVLDGGRIHDLPAAELSCLIAAIERIASVDDEDCLRGGKDLGFVIPVATWHPDLGAVPALVTRIRAALPAARIWVFENGFGGQPAAAADGEYLAFRASAKDIRFGELPAPPEPNAYPWQMRERIDLLPRLKLEDLRGEPYNLKLPEAGRAFKEVSRQTEGLTLALSPVVEWFAGPLATRR